MQFWKSPVDAPAHPATGRESLFSDADGPASPRLPSPAPLRAFSPGCAHSTRSRKRQPTAAHTAAEDSPSASASPRAATIPPPRRAVPSRPRPARARWRVPDRPSNWKTPSQPLPRHKPSPADIPVNPAAAPQQSGFFQSSRRRCGRKRRTTDFSVGRYRLPLRVPKHPSRRQPSVWAAAFRYSAGPAPLHPAESGRR